MNELDRLTGVSSNQRNVSRDGLISVPLTTRPKPGEVTNYLRSFQVFIVDRAIHLLKDPTFGNPNAFDAGLTKNLQRLITALSTDLEKVRIPVVWAAFNKASSYFSVVEERVEAPTTKEFSRLLEATSILLSHFDLARHLSESELRVKQGDDEVDEALFHELDEQIMEFDRSRAEVFSDFASRAERLSTAVTLRVGASPTATYLMYRAYRGVFTTFQAFAPAAYSIIGLVLFSYIFLDDQYKGLIRQISELFGGQ